MKYQIDHDLHVHSYISPCAKHDPRQTKEAILAYGLTNGYNLLCVTDHIWDRKVQSVERNGWLNRGLDFEKAKEILPLPQSEKCRFLFGIEADMDYLGNIAVSSEEYDTFDFIILAPSHLHLKGFARNPEEVGSSAAELKEFYKKRLFAILNMNLPFHKCGLAHFTACLNSDEGKFEVLNRFSDQEYREIFSLAAERGIGVEINVGEVILHCSPEDRESILRPYRVAKEMGCKFYLGSDAHSPEDFIGQKNIQQHLIDLLGLTEDEKFPFVKEFGMK